MSNPYDELSERARWFMENFDECGVAEICANNEAAAQKAQDALERVRAIKKSPSRSPYNLHANAQDDGWDQALDAVLAAIGDPPRPADTASHVVAHGCPPDGSGLT